ncbi:MAG TPA: hypothetical protein HPP77_01905 [Candidatus Hydrogenedentes bacterium]|nr:hypothetical protein [Candidatus Hydrogenedentota bacterium]
MPYPQLDRRKLNVRPLCERKNKVEIERDLVPLTAKPRPFADRDARIVDETVARMQEARDSGRARMLAFGAHTIKNGLATVLIRLIESGWITHLATNGAGIIHDWEFAFQGRSSEDVRTNMAQGRFGLWEETGYYINLALIVGAYEGLGYGESIGKFVENDGLEIPSEQELRNVVESSLESDVDKAAAAADLLQAIRTFDVNSGWMKVPHRYRPYGLQAAAYRLGVPFTGHPMIGHDIIYCHAMNSCAAVGRAAQRDFLTFANSVFNIDGGVYLSIGSAVMSPMVFEKSMAMAQNLAIQNDWRIENHVIVVVDLQESNWDWSRGEPGEDNPDYYLRYCKSFSRAGGAMRYLCADNRDFLLAVLQRLDNIKPQAQWRPRGERE